MVVVLEVAQVVVHYGSNVAMKINQLVNYDGDVRGDGEEKGG